MNTRKNAVVLISIGSYSLYVLSAYLHSQFITASLFTATADQKTRAEDFLNDNKQLDILEDAYLLTSVHDGQEPNYLIDDGMNATLRIAFVGDSLTRYQYLDLAYYLRFNEWAKDNAHASKVIVKSWPRFTSWNSYYRYVDKVLMKGNEGCDCYRPKGRYKANDKTAQIYENRYFRFNGHYLTYIQKWGIFESHGHWLPPHQIYEERHAVDIKNRKSYDKEGRLYTWKYSNWHDIVRNYLSLLQPRPDYVVINAGLWPHDLRNTTIVDLIRTALDEFGMIGIYKTTTKHNYDNSTATEAYEEYACRVFHYCLNLSWTGMLAGDEYYSDDKHFTPQVNTRFNYQLLRLLRSIEQEQNM